MSKGKCKMIELLGGLAMLAVGLYWFSTIVKVTNGFMTYGLRFGGFSVNSGAVIIPFVVALILLLFKPKSFGRRVFFGITVLLIIASVILSTKFYIARLSLFEWICILVLIFGGAALALKSTLGK